MALNVLKGGSNGNPESMSESWQNVKPAVIKLLEGDIWKKICKCSVIHSFRVRILSITWWLEHLEYSMLLIVNAFNVITMCVFGNGGGNMWYHAWNSHSQQVTDSHVVVFGLHNCPNRVTDSIITWDGKLCFHFKYCIFLKQFLR